MKIISVSYPGFLTTTEPSGLEKLTCNSVIIFPSGTLKYPGGYIVADHILLPLSVIGTGFPAITVPSANITLGFI